MPIEAPLRCLIHSKQRSSRLALSAALCLSTAAMTIAQDAPPVAPAPPAGPAVAVAPAGITITVDGVPMDLPAGRDAIEEHGRILVPLRGIFERLGAKVKYTPSAKSIYATRGDTSILLTIGGATAVVNGEPRALSTPAELLGGATTLVPLRFVSEALGARVKWIPATRTVAITTAEALATAPPTITPTAPTPDAAAAPARIDSLVTGTLASIDLAGGPTVVVHSDAQTPPDTQIILTPDARILQKRADDPAVATTAANLHLGDQVTVRRNPMGLGYDIEADYIEQKGPLKSETAADNGATRLTFGDDTTVDITSGAPVTLGGNPAALTDLKAPMVVSVRINPVTKLGTSVSAALPEVKIAGLAIAGADKTLKANDSVTFTLTGTPGGTATVSVDGLTFATNVPLTESAAQPGTYGATLTIPPGYALDHAAVTGSLTLAGVASPVFTAPGSLAIDSQPPVIADIEPGDGKTVTDRRPDINGTLSDLGSGIDPATAQLLINGTDVTAQAKITKGFFLFHPTSDLPAGGNKVTFVVKDAVGNVAQKDWVFSILPPASPIKVVTVSAPEGQAMQTGDTLKVRAEATPGGTAKFAIGANVITGAMTEDMPGIYTGAYTIQRGDSLTGVPVTVTFTPPGGGKDVTFTAVQAVTIAAGPPVAPIIDLPLEGSYTGQYVTITGHGTPNTTVRLSIQYAGKVLILNKQGNIATIDLKVGADGSWTTDLLTLDTHGSSNVTYTASAITVLKDGEVSDPAVVHFKQ